MNAYHRARVASEKQRHSDFRAADHLARVFTDKADADFSAGRITAGERNALHAAAGDSGAALSEKRTTGTSIVWQRSNGISASR